MADSSSSSGGFAQPLSDRVQQPTVNVTGFTPAAGSVSDAQVATDAEIAQSKLNLAITDAEVAAGAAIAQSKLALAVTNSEVSSSAAVAQTKVASSLGKTSLSADVAYLDAKLGSGRHLESGRASVATGTVVAITFTTAFSATPATFANCESSNLGHVANAFSPSTTGVSVATNSPSTETVSWFAVG